MMMVVTLAAAFGARAATWADPGTGIMWTYQINGETAERTWNTARPTVFPCAALQPY